MLDHLRSLRRICYGNRNEGREQSQRSALQGFRQDRGIGREVTIWSEFCSGVPRRYNFIENALVGLVPGGAEIVLLSPTDRRRSKVKVFRDPIHLSVPSPALPTGSARPNA